MKELKINIPEGYDIDKENSTFDLIKFKKIDPAIKWNSSKIGVEIQDSKTFNEYEEALEDALKYALENLL